MEADGRRLAPGRSSKLPKLPTQSGCTHSATVAREYGLSCVSNVDGATWRLRDGDVLRVDGTHGKVEIVERSDRA